MGNYHSYRIELDAYNPDNELETSYKKLKGSGDVSTVDFEEVYTDIIRNCGKNAQLKSWKIDTYDFIPIEFGETTTEFNLCQRNTSSKSGTDISLNRFRYEVMKHH